MAQDSLLKSYQANAKKHMLATRGKPARGAISTESKILSAIEDIISQSEHRDQLYLLQRHQKILDSKLPPTAFATTPTRRTSTKPPQTKQPAPLMSLPDKTWKNALPRLHQKFFS